MPDGMRARKPMLTAKQQVEHLKSRGVRFELCSEGDAVEYLSDANNYLRAAAYRKLYFRQVDGDNPGDYVNLDFEDLVELSSIDRRLREALRDHRRRTLRQDAPAAHVRGARRGRLRDRLRLPRVD